MFPGEAKLSTVAPSVGQRSGDPQLMARVKLVMATGHNNVISGGSQPSLVARFLQPDKDSPQLVHLRLHHLVPATRFLEALTLRF